MFSRVLIRRTITAPRPATLLTRTQVHPRRTNLHALLADALVREFYVGDGVNVCADFCRHNKLRLYSNVVY
jgi:hypothetical protein